MKVFSILTLSLFVSFGAFAQNHIDARGREWKRLDKAAQFNSAGASALCPGAICTGAYTGYTWANADEVSELISDFGSADNFIASMGHTYMFVTTYTYDIGSVGLTSSVDSVNGLPIVVSASSGHASVTAYDSLAVGAAADSFYPLMLYKNGQIPLNCSLDGVSILHGQGVTRSQSATVPNGETCKSEVRTCTNGVLSGTFTALSCQALPPAPVNCMLNGVSILHGQSVTRSQSATVSYGQTCKSEVRTCNNGIVSGSYAALSCQVLPQCLKWDIKKGQSVCKKYAGSKS